VSCNKTRARMHCWTQRFKKFSYLLLLGTVLITLTAATANAAISTPFAANATGAQPLVGATTHPIQYWIGCPPSMVDDGSSLSYFQQHGFTAVVLVVPDNQTYQTELNKIKSLGMTPIIDVEAPIWNEGQLSNTPITNFSSYFQSLENAGWHYVASEGGRTGDLAYMKNYFQGYVNFNCDQCGLWGNVYKDPFTVANSWESYYTAEWPYMQNGSTQAAALGIQNGILAGVWNNTRGANQILANSLSGSTPSYKSMLDWSYANGIGFTSFHAWCGASPRGLSNYKACGLESVVADLQTYYPPSSSAPFGGSWSSLGGQLASGTGPAVCAQNANSLDAFVQGTDHTLWHKSFQGSAWSAWASLGGNLASSPAATSPANGVMDVLAGGTNGALYSKQLSGGTWGSWKTIGGQSASGTGPAVCAQNANSLDAFVQGTDHALWYTHWDGTKWSSWKSLGGNLASSPAATSPANGVIDVFVRGTNGALWSRSTTNGGASWSNWSSLGGQLASGTGPAVYAQNANSLDAFVQGTDHALWHKSLQGSAWSAWASLGGNLTSSPAATSPANGVIDVFVRGTDGAVWQRGA